MSVSTLSFNDNGAVYLAALAIRAMVRTIIWALWLVLRCAGALCGLWRPVALTLAIAGAVAVCAIVPALPIGLAIVAAFGWATKPRTVRPCSGQS